MNPPVHDASDPVLIAFIHAIKINFGEDPFEAVEGFLARSWNQCRIEGDPEWPEIRDQVRESWPSTEVSKSRS